jgi:hypothetical protein
MLVFLYACFRQARGVILPFVVVLMSIVVAMGMIPVLGWKIQMITIMMPVMLVAVANDYGIHMIAKFQEYNSAGSSLSKENIAKRMVQSLGKPVLMTGLTTIAGFLCLLGHILIPGRQVGILASAGIVYALAASLLFIPAVSSLLSNRKKVIGAVHGEDRQPLLERLLGWFASLVAHRPRAVVAGSLLFALAVSTGMLFIEVDTDPNDYYPERSPIVKTARLINDNFGGMTNFSIVLSGDIKDPSMMKKIDRYERDIESLDHIGLTSSIARVVRMMSRALNDPGEPGYDAIPDSREAIAQYFMLYSMSGDPDDFEKLVDFPYENAQIMARVNTTSVREIREARKKIEAMVAGDPDVKFMAGFGLIFTDLATLVVRGQMWSLIMAVGAVGILVMILFRSIAAGLISSMPLGVSMMVLFGLMGYFGIELNVATAMLSSIMIGVGVDYTIHFLWRYREERRSGRAPSPAVATTLTTTGRGIVFNALSVVVGFIVMLVSSFLPVRFFGFLVVVSIMACLIGALMIVPSLCLVIKPKFLEPVEERVMG